jgi:hypothetical protein
MDRGWFSPMMTTFPPLTAAAWGAITGERIVAPTLAYVLGAPVPKDAEGNVLKEMVTFKS